MGYVFGVSNSCHRNTRTGCSFYNDKLDFTWVAKKLALLHLAILSVFFALAS